MYYFEINLHTNTFVNTEIFLQDFINIKRIIHFYNPKDPVIKCRTFFARVQ